ncbi:MAG TPA: galactokinase [Cyclobacteriaceae bacterium]|nr:galactokinase [Cyclobacteriaceae bacterium]
MPDSAIQLADDFWKRFNKIPFLFTAPGRINLIGEHVDYNGGLVMPAAIDKHFIFAIAPGRNDKCNIYASDFNEGVTFSIHDLNPGESWVNYLMGVIDAFLRKGLAIDGVDCIFTSDIPAGAGLSSSAALCSGFAFALNEIFKCGLSKVELVKVAQYAENEFAGVNCGIMDQYASLFGEEGSALLLDCQSLKHEVLPALSSSHSIILIDSKVKHTLAASAYNDRRLSCEEGVKVIRKKHPAVKTLRDVSRTALYENQDKLGEDTFVKCLFVIEEIVRTAQAAEALKKNDLKAFGELMYLSHWGLSQAYDVSCEELDFLVLQAEEDKSKVPGARMMGGGFGGCTINLVQKNYEGIFKETVRKKYFATFKREPDFYSVKLSRGVHQINLP